MCNCVHIVQLYYLIIAMLEFHSLIQHRLSKRKNIHTANFFRFKLGKKAVSGDKTLVRVKIHNHIEQK